MRSKEREALLNVVSAMLEATLATYEGLSATRRALADVMEGNATNGAKNLKAAVEAEMTTQHLRTAITAFRALGEVLYEHTDDA